MSRAEQNDVSVLRCDCSAGPGARTGCESAIMARLYIERVTDKGSALFFSDTGEQAAKRTRAGSSRGTNLAASRHGTAVKHSPVTSAHKFRQAPMRAAITAAEIHPPNHQGTLHQRSAHKEARMR